MVSQHLKIFWHGEDYSAGDRKKEQKGEENRRRDGKIGSGMEFGDSLRVAEDGKVESLTHYCCNVICGVLSTVKVQGLRGDEMK